MAANGHSFKYKKGKVDKNSEGKAVNDSSLCQCENMQFFEHARIGFSSEETEKAGRVILKLHGIGH